MRRPRLRRQLGGRENAATAAGDARPEAGGLRALDSGPGPDVEVLGPGLYKDFAERHNVPLSPGHRRGVPGIKYTGRDRPRVGTYISGARRRALCPLPLQCRRQHAAAEPARGLLKQRTGLIRPACELHAALADGRCDGKEAKGHHTVCGVPFSLLICRTRLAHQPTFDHGDVPTLGCSSPGRVAGTYPTAEWTVARVDAPLWHPVPSSLCPH